MRNFYINFLSILIICCVGIKIYSNTYYSSFHFDDFTSIVNDPYIRNIHNLQYTWYFWPSRFITYLSIAFNYHLNGLNVFGYHLFNLAVHLISAVLVWWLVRLTLLTPALKEDKITRHADIVALFTGLVFVSHPIQTQAVTYIIQRAASLATLFYLASLCFYIKSRFLPDDLPMQRIYYICSLMTAILAMFSKEMAVSLPLMILLYEYCFLKTKGRCLTPFLLTLLIIPVTMLLTHSLNFQEMRSKWGKPPGISSTHYFISQFRVLVTYIRLMFFPFHQNLDYDYHIPKTIFEWPTLVSLLFLGTILFWAKRLLLKYRLVSFSIFWFFLTLLPESSFWPIRDVIFEHRLYLPMVGYSIFLVSGAFYLFGKNNFQAMVIALTVIIACYAMMTYQRNKVWWNEFTLWDDTVQKSPYKARGYINRGLAYYNQGNFTQALLDDSKAIVLNPNDHDVYYNRGLVFYHQKDFKRAIADYNSAIKLDPNRSDDYYNRGNAYYEAGNFVQAIADYNETIVLEPHNEDAYNNRGLAYSKRGDPLQAISDYNKAVEIDPKDVDAYLNLAFIYYQLRKYDRSWENVHRAEELGRRVSAKFINKLKVGSGRDK